MERLRFLVLVLLVGCGGGSQNTPPTPPPGTQLVTCECKDGTRDSTLCPASAQPECKCPEARANCH